MELERRIRFAGLSAADRARIGQEISRARSGISDGAALFRLWGKPAAASGPALLIALAAAAALAFAVWRGFGELGAEGVVGGPAMMGVCGVLLATLFGAFLWALPRHWLERAAGLPGIYMFAGHIVDTREPLWRVRSLQGLREFRATAAGKVRGLDRIRLVFTAADGTRWVYLMHGKEQAEKAIARLREANAALRAAAQQGSLEEQRRIDPFVGLSVPVAPLPLAALQRLPRAALIGALAGAALAWPLQTFRDQRSDERQWAQARALNTEQAYQSYLTHPLQFKAQAQAALPRAALQDARKAGTVTALRAALARYPQGGIAADVQADVRAIYDKAFARFKSRLNRQDPVLLDVVASALRRAEASGDPRVDIRFARPPAAEITKLDARVSQLAPGAAGTAAAASHFQGNTAAQREKRMAEELKSAFGRVFPTDVLTANTTPVTTSNRPYMAIAYNIRPSGMVYRSEQTGRQFIGVTIGFAAEMQAPEVAPAWRFKLDVLPPERFQVSEKSPADASVYAVMADRAFDELGSKLVHAFFGKS